jgi:hypothetical protein
LRIAFAFFTTFGEQIMTTGLKGTISLAVAAATATAVVSPAQAATESATSSTELANPVAEQQSELAQRAAEGKLRPSEVKAAIEALGLGIADTPLSSIFAEPEHNPSGTVKTSDLICNGSWCIVVKPNLATAASSTQISASEAEALVARLQRRDRTTLGQLLSELDEHHSQRDWSVRLRANGAAVS